MRFFLPGKETVEVYDLHRFRMTSEGNYALWKVKDTKKLAYSFRTTADKGWLENTSVALSGTPYALNWTYGEFCKLGAAYFPQHILAELMGSGKTYSLDMKLSRMSVGEDWETRTSLSSKYKKDRTGNLAQNVVGKMKRFVVISCICFYVCTLTAQTTPKIRQLEKQRNELKQQIAESETLLQSTKKDVKSQLGNLALLSGQIEERQKYIQTIENDVKAIQQEISRLERDLKSLQKRTERKSDRSMNCL